MKPDARLLNVNSTLTGEKVNMTLDPDAAAHLMSVLTDLYSDPEMAVIREYSTNAYDAHIEAGTKRPIEVVTPSSLSPFFRVKDFGVGLDIEDIRNIYSRYGASSKRESNDVVGMLGLGCKSALTYTDQFTLTGVKNGIATQVSVSRNEDGGGSMTIVNEYETDDPSGVEVIVPVKSYNEFQNKAAKFFRFWNTGTVLLNGKEPERIDGLWVADDLLLAKGLEHPVVVMGNVPYPVPVEGYNNTKAGFPAERSYDSVSHRYTYNALVAFVNIGDVQFTPSREQLQYTKKTNETLVATRDRYVLLRDTALTNRINDAKTKHEAVEVAMDARIYSRTLKFQYKGVEIPEVVKLTKEHHAIVVDAVKRYHNKGWGTTDSLGVNTWHKASWIIGYTAATFSPYRRKKLEQWAKNNDIVNENSYLFVNEVPKEIAPWIDSSKVYQWDTIDAEKIDKAPGSTTTRSGRLTGSYDVQIGANTTTLLADQIDTTKPIYYRNRIQYQNQVDVNLLGIGILVNLPLNRVNKFVRDFPNAVKWHEAVSEMAKTWHGKLTELDKLALGLSSHHQAHTMFKSLDPSKIDDPDVQELATAAKYSHSLKVKFNLFSHLLGTSSFRTKDIDHGLKKYPLLLNMQTYGTMSTRFNEHLHTYINAAFAAEQES